MVTSSQDPRFESDALQAAQVRCSEMLRQGLSDYQAKHTLLAEGFDEHLVRAVLHEYVAQREARQRRRRIWRRRLGIVIVVAGLAAAFHYGPSSRILFVAAVSIAFWGLLRALLP